MSAESSDAAIETVNVMIDLENHVIEKFATGISRQNNKNESTTFKFITEEEAKEISLALTKIFEIRAKISKEATSADASLQKARAMNATAANKAMQTVLRLDKHMEERSKHIRLLP